MRKIKVFALVLSLATACLVTALSSTASATTDYDNVTVSGGSLVISYHAQPWTGVTCTNNVLDLTNSWKSLIRDESKWDVGGGASSTDPTDAVADFEDALERGNGWGVTQVYNNEDGLNSFGSSLLAYGGTHDTWLEVWWNDTGTASFHNVSPFGYSLVADGNVHTAFIYFSNATGHQCEPRVTQHVLDITSPAVNAAMAIDNTAYTGLQWFPVFLNFDVTYPSGYEGAAAPTSLPPAEYVAMGDSFSSGEGNSPFEYGTDTSGVDECHRSPDAYPEWLDQTPSLDLGSMISVACSGATTHDVIYGGSAGGSWGEGPQINALSTSTEYVTLTVGGDDVGFKTFATACAAGSCDNSSTSYSTIMDNIDDDLPAKIDDVLDHIVVKTDDAKVYVVGYPYLTPPTLPSPVPAQCLWLSIPIGTSDTSAARDVVDELNNTIQTEVEGYVNSTNDTTFTFVNPNLSVDGSFDGHDICSGLDSYFYNIDTDDPFILTDLGTRDLHPNVNGQYEYYQIVSGAISADQ